jgi:hypothetical protein
MIVERLPEGFRVAETARDGLVHPEIFSREGALIRRADVRFDGSRNGDLPFFRKGHLPCVRILGAGGGCLSLGLAVA